MIRVFVLACLFVAFLAAELPAADCADGSCRAARPLVRVATAPVRLIRARPIRRLVAARPIRRLFRGGCCGG